MRDLSNLTAKIILENRKPEALFSRDKNILVKEFRALIKHWHPDRNKDPLAQKVTDHILVLHREALKKLKEDHWIEVAEKLEFEEPGKKKIRMKDGSIKTFSCYRTTNFELGSLFIDDNYVLFEIDKSFEDLLRNARYQIRSLPFQDQDMAAEISRYLPEIYDTFSGASGDYLLIRKTPDQILLADLLNHYGGTLPGEHIAWILNCLYNLLTYFSFAGITHNAINPGTLFVSPLRHSIMLLGGWWYATPIGSPMSALPMETLEHIDGKVLEDKIANANTDLALASALGAKLLSEKDPFYPILNKWFGRSNKEISDSALGEYSLWKYEVLEQAYGKPQFVEMKVKKEEIYKIH